MTLPPPVDRGWYKIWYKIWYKVSGAFRNVKRAGPDRWDLPILGRLCEVRKGLHRPGDIQQSGVSVDIHRQANSRMTHCRLGRTWRHIRFAQMR
ncbi:MAG: hypothetical protein QGH60_13195, partial [Phycisphaerae bacterium]|nr:hypothetical protein [Phycisphaerae bacterium]